MKSKLSIVSLILSIISLDTILVWILPVGSSIQSNIIEFAIYNIFIAPIGLILGIISLFIIKRNKLEGIWFAILSIIFSIIGILAIISLGMAVASAAFSFL